VATFHPKLRFIVQDQPSQEEIFKSQVPRNLRSRISFQAHDFFTPQPVKGADVYFLSAVLHDWSDEMALKILQQLVPTMKPSTRILVFEGIMAEFGEVTNAQMRITRSVDLMMLSLLNGKERTKENWMQLVENADPKLTVKNIVSPSFGGPRPLIEIGFGDK
jgi:6-hydroxytryprostatin B O-methyltransferase